MPRVKGGTVTRARRKKTIKLAKGYFGAKHTLYKVAKQQVMKSGQYAFRDRRQRKRDFRKLWITRINAAARQHDMSYSRLMNGLKKLTSILTVKCFLKLLFQMKSFRRVSFKS